MQTHTRTNRPFANWIKVCDDNADADICWLMPVCGQMRCGKNSRPRKRCQFAKRIRAFSGQMQADGALQVTSLAAFHRRTKTHGKRWQRLFSLAKSVGLATTCACLPICAISLPSLALSALGIRRRTSITRICDDYLLHSDFLHTHVRTVQIRPGKPSQWPWRCR